ARASGGRGRPRVQRGDGHGDDGEHAGAAADGGGRPRGADRVRAGAAGRAEELEPGHEPVAGTGLEAERLAGRRPEADVRVHCGRRERPVMWAAMLQDPSRLNALDLVLGGSLSAQIVLGVTALFSLVSWLIIFWKLGQFRRVRRQGMAFVRSTERLHRLEDISRSVLRLPDSPYTRVFRNGITFFGELRPGAFREGAEGGQGLSEAQLHALRLVLEKGQAEELDQLAAGLAWLEIIAATAPLLGLLGTVIGVMNSFLGVAHSGSA